MWWNYIDVCNDLATSATPPWSAECDFEDENVCGYTNYLYNTYDWVRHSGGTSTGSTGPSNDHTLGTAEGKLLGSLSHK